LSRFEDDDERIAPPTSREKRKALVFDRLLTVTGLALAGAAAFFPWYVFFNEDKFSINIVKADWTRELPDWAARNVRVSALAIVNKNDPEKRPELPLDPLTTATVSNLGEEKDEGAAVSENQSFPAASGFKLLHVANGRALIEDSSGMYVVRVGSVLPDESRLATLEDRDGKWVMVTSRGEVYQND
jgi:hypothetical protein